MTVKTATELAFERARATHPALARQLEFYVRELAERHPATASAYQALVETLTRCAAGAAAPKVGDPLSPFVLPDEAGRLRSSDALLADGPLVISFNRGSWCPLCWLELTALNDRRADIARLGGGIVSIVPETATHSRRLKARLGLGFPLLTDLDNACALALGLATSLSAEIREIFIGAGIDIGLYQRNDAWFVPIPATLVVDRTRIVRASYVNADFRQRGDLARLIAALS